MTSTNLEDAWRTDRLSFRMLRDTDYEWFFDGIESDPVNRALSSPSHLAPPRRTKPEDWIRGFNSLLHLVICLRTNGPGEPEQQDIGQADEKRVGYLDLHYGPCGRSQHNRSCELGITLTAPYQDKGYGTEAVQWALDWAFLRGNMHSVHLSALEFNTRAQRCYEKCGFKLEGRIRHCMWHERKFYDDLQFGILEEEWEALRNAKE